MFANVFAALRPGGSVWLSDLVTHGVEAVQALMWQRYGAYLEDTCATRPPATTWSPSVAREDTPRSLVYQLDLLRRVGFEAVDVLHKTSVFAAFGGVKAV